MGISGTPVKDGDYDKVVQAALKAAKDVDIIETELITLADNKIAMCEHCQYCMENRTVYKIQDYAQMLYKE